MQAPLNTPHPAGSEGSPAGEGNGDAAAAAEVDRGETVSAPRGRGRPPKKRKNGFPLPPARGARGRGRGRVAKNEARIHISRNERQAAEKAASRTLNPRHGAAENGASARGGKLRKRGRPRVGPPKFVFKPSPQKAKNSEDRPQNGVDRTPTKVKQPLFDPDPDSPLVTFVGRPRRFDDFSANGELMIELTPNKQPVIELRDYEDGEVKAEQDEELNDTEPIDEDEDYEAVDSEISLKRVAVDSADDNSSMENGENPERAVAEAEAENATVCEMVDDCMVNDEIDAMEEHMVIEPPEKESSDVEQNLELESEEESEEEVEPEAMAIKEEPQEIASEESDADNDNENVEEESSELDDALSKDTETVAETAPEEPAKSSAEKDGKEVDNQASSVEEKEKATDHESTEKSTENGDLNPAAEVAVEKVEEKKEENKEVEEAEEPLTVTKSGRKIHRPQSHLSNPTSTPTPEPKSATPSVAATPTLAANPEALEAALKEFEAENPPLFTAGHMLWSKIGSSPYWPSAVTPDPDMPEVPTVTRVVNVRQKIVREYHVQFYGKVVQRAWMLAHNVFAYEGGEKFHEETKKLKETMKNKKSQSNKKVLSSRMPAGKTKTLWEEAITGK